MPDKSNNHEATNEEELGLDDFRQPDDDGGLSLEDLTSAYAQLIDSGALPYETEPAVDVTEPTEGSESEYSDEADDDQAVANLGCEVSPRSILESMLFVGSPDNQPLSSKQVASLMRGVRAQEIDELVHELNAEYEELACPYRIEALGEGYVLRLREVYGALREKFYGKVREARLSQSAVDILAIVAYNQPLNREAVDKLRGRPSGGVLNQLVRRQLLKIERPDKRPRQPVYRTTDRFLYLFGLENLSELPQTQDLDKNL